MSYYVSIITLTWRDSCIKRWQFSTSTLFHPKFEWATLPSFRHFRHLHSSWKGFDSGIRMQGYCLVQCSGVHQQVLADQWSVQTIWIARWKGIDNLNIFEHRPGSFGRVFNTFQRACEIWYRLIMMNRWAIMYPSSPWRGETAASRDGNFRRVPCFIQSSNEQHSQISVTFVTFTHPERVLILGSGCKDTALYNVQGSISRSWQISRQCKQSASRGEHRPGSFGRIFNTWERVFVIWYRWSTMYPSSPWRGETAASRDSNFGRVPCIIQRMSYLGNPESKHHLCTLRMQKGQVKGLPKPFFSSNWAEREDQTVCHENTRLEITFPLLISTSPLCIPKVQRPSKTSFAWLTWH